MGTDTGGSIRIPASFCGACGIRVTGYRLRYLVGGGACVGSAQPGETRGLVHIMILSSSVVGEVDKVGGLPVTPASAPQLNTPCLVQEGVG